MSQTDSVSEHATWSAQDIDLGADDFAVRLPRLAPGGLSADGTRLLVSQVLPDAEGAGTRSSLWEVDATGVSQARCLPTERDVDSPAYLGDAVVAMADLGGDGRQLVKILTDGSLEPITAMPGGCVLVTAGPGPVAVIMTRPETCSAPVRERLGVTAEWHESFPARRLGQTHHMAAPRLWAVRADTGETVELTPESGTEAFGMRASGAPAVLSRDGDTLALGWGVQDGWATRTVTLLIDTTTGVCRTGLDLPGRDVVPSQFCAEGRVLVCTSTGPMDVESPTGPEAHVVDLTTGLEQRLFGSVAPYVWQAVPTADGQEVIALSDESGHAVLDVVSPATGVARRLPVSTHGHVMALQPTPDGQAIVGWGSGVDRPPHPVRIDLSDGTVTALELPGPPCVHPGVLDEQWVELPDGRGRVHGQLALPQPGEDGSPVPLLVFLHGGPGGAWGSWTGGWSPWPAVARGYAVLLANIAPSTGYGESGMSRAWPMRGRESLEDLLALLDQVHAHHPRIDPDRVGLLGCSHGGFLVNWFAGATDRFRAGVSLAGIWDLRSMQETTDMTHPLVHPDDLDSASPRLQVDRIRMPMLVVHGQHDHRVPLTQALWQWRDLLTAHERRGPGGDQPHRLLIFPDEHHGVTRPHNLTCWWQAVLAFMDTHVRGLAWQWPDTLDPRHPSARTTPGSMT